VVEQHRIKRVHGEEHRLATGQQRLAHRHAPGVVGVEHRGHPGATRQQAFDMGQLVQGLDAVEPQVIAADIQDHVDVAALEREAALEDAAARGLQHRHLHRRVGQHPARRPVA